ncbi:MAG: DUF2892 domain-containing protein [Alphaproteobacteria bacterium]
MSVSKAVMMFAGIMVLIGTALALWVSVWGLALTAFVGLNLIQSSLTGFCPAAIVFRKLGLQPGDAFK